MEISYKRNFIANFIVRFDFPAIEVDAHHSSIGELLSENGFPIREVNTINSVPVNIDPNGPKLGDVQSQSEYIFANTGRDSQFKINNSSLVYESIKYSGYSSVAKKINVILTFIISELAIKSFSRIGIRYVNLIDLPFKKAEEILIWDKYINQKYISSLKAYDKPESLIQYIQQYDINSAEENNLYTMQVGIPNPIFPAELVKKIFLIDLDGYSKNAIEPSEAKEKLNSLHTKVSSLFEDVITDELRSVLND